MAPGKVRLERKGKGYKWRKSLLSPSKQYDEIRNLGKLLDVDIDKGQALYVEFMYVNYNFYCNATNCSR